MITCTMEYYTRAIQECGRSTSTWEDPQDMLLSKNKKPNTIMLKKITACNYLWAKMKTLFISTGTYIYMECTVKGLQYTKMLTVIIS